MLDTIFTSTEFWAALLGVLAAFLLEAMRRWWSDNTKRQASINLTIVSLAQMYTAMRNYHDQVFIDGRERLVAILGREPHPFEYKAASGLVKQDLRINYDDLGCLLRSHDPDILNRILVAERTYLTWHHQMTEHVVLHRELQRRSALVIPAQQSMPLQQFAATIGQDIFAQINDVASDLRDKMPKAAEQLVVMHQQLRDVARVHFPTRRFAGLSKTPRKEATLASNVGRPKWWRRLVRSLWSTEVHWPWT